jgi:hypothetical protein
MRNDVKQLKGFERMYPKDEVGKLRATVRQMNRTIMRLKTRLTQLEHDPVFEEYRVRTGAREEDALLH